jgi:hypothetical protein
MKMAKVDEFNYIRIPSYMLGANARFAPLPKFIKSDNFHFLRR